jgi:hypothetical protein
MARAKFPIAEGGEKRLQVEWGFGFKNLKVSFDGEIVGLAPTLQNVPGGVTMALPTGQQVSVALVKNLGQPEVHVLLDGEPVPGSASDPVQRAKVASGVTFFVGGLNVLLGLVGLASGSAMLENIGIGLPSIFFGTVFITLGVFVRKASLGALWAAIILFGLDGLSSLAFVFEAGGRMPVGSIVIRILFLLIMARAIPALKELRLKKAKLTSTAEGGATGAPVGVSVAPKDE